MLPASSTAPGASCMPVMRPAAVSSTASDGVQAPGVSVSAAAADTTHTRFAATTLISTGCDAQAPTGDERVPKTTYTCPVLLLVKMFDGPPESAHCRSR